MSDVSDRIILMLTDEWQTTREIADLAGVGPQRAYKTLCKEFKYGLVEQGKYKKNGTHGMQWRRIVEVML